MDTLLVSPNISGNNIISHFHAAESSLDATQDTCPTKEIGANVIAAGSSSLIALAVVVITIGVIIKIKLKRRHKSNDQPRYIPLQEELYDYDVFIFCAEEDDENVERFIENGLREQGGYSILRKHTAPDGLFTAGNTKISDIAKITDKCSIIIIVCSKNNKMDHSEVSYCKDHCAGRVIPIFLDDAEDENFKELTHRRISVESLSDWKARENFIKQLHSDISKINK